MIDLDLFFDISRDVAMATDFMRKNGKLPIVCQTDRQTDR